MLIISFYLCFAFSLFFICLFVTLLCVITLSCSISFAYPIACACLPPIGLANCLRFSSSCCFVLSCYLSSYVSSLHVYVPSASIFIRNLIKINLGLPKYFRMFTSSSPGDLPRLLRVSQCLRPIDLQISQN